MAKRFLKTTVVSVIFALTLAVSASAATAGGATTTTAVNFRTGAGTNYGIISTLPAGTHVVVSERSSGNWATVVYNGTVGYISSDYLKRANDMDASFGTGTIDGSYVRMRSGASTSSSILGTYNSGTTMTVTGVSGAWYKVNYNGTDGYVHSDYVSLSGVTSSGGSASGSNGSVKGSDVRMRSGPGTNYSILGTYQNGTALTVTGTENGWSKVTIGGTSGYIRSDYVSGGADSMALLGRVVRAVRDKGMRPLHIDATIIAERPKMAPHIEQMRKNVSEALHIEVDQVNIKATTEEGLGFTGTGEGISSQAIASLDTIANYSYRVGPSEGGCAGCGGCMKVQES